VSHFSFKYFESYFIGFKRRFEVVKSDSGNAMQL